jgi:predicted Ser/Thr protein kinase
MAERDGDHWVIDFEPAKMKEGNIKLPRVSTADAANKGFEAV